MNNTQNKYKWSINAFLKCSVLVDIRGVQIKSNQDSVFLWKEWLSQRNQITKTGKASEKMEPSYIVDENVNLHNHYGNQ